MPEPVFSSDSRYSRAASLSGPAAQRVTPSPSGLRGFVGTVGGSVTLRTWPGAAQHRFQRLNRLRLVRNVLRKLRPIMGAMSPDSNAPGSSSPQKQNRLRRQTHNSQSGGDSNGTSGTADAADNCRTSPSGGRGAGGHGDGGTGGTGTGAGARGAWVGNNLPASRESRSAAAPHTVRCLCTRSSVNSSMLPDTTSRPLSNMWN